MDEHAQVPFVETKLFTYKILHLMYSEVKLLHSYLG